MTRLDDLHGSNVDDSGDDPKQPWHNSTPAVLGASAAGIAVIAVIWAVISWVSAPSDLPSGPPMNFVDPSFADGSSQTTTTTTPTITSTAQISTTEIDAPTGPSTTTDSSTTSSTSGSEPSPTPRTRENDDDGPTTRTTHRPPRFNETRTLYPRPIG